MESSSWIDSSLSLSLNPNPPNFKIKNSEDEMSEELKRARMENKKLTEMLTTMYESYSALQTQVADLMSRSTKRKSPDYGGDGVQTDQSSSSSDDESNVFKKPRTNVAVAGVISRKPSSRVLVRTDKSDNTLIVKDGYQWRKYGQKVTRDNPCPRAYFKCSFAPSCQVKKKVQRSAEDQTMLVATYDGEHNHPPPSEIDTSSQRNSNSSSCVTNSISSSAIIQSKPVVTLDLIKPVDETKQNRTSSGAVKVHNLNQNESQNGSMLQKFIVEQMASSLTNDPSFKAAVAAAISGRMMDSSNNNNGKVGKWL